MTSSIDKKFLIFTIFFSIFAILIVLRSAFASTYLKVYATGLVQPGGNITISGGVYNSSNLTQGIPSVNVSAIVVSGGNGSYVTGTDGTFEFNITAPLIVGTYPVNISTNESEPQWKMLPVHVGNMTAGSITFVGKAPPYSPGKTFSINVTILNGTTKVSGYTPDIGIYSANGPEVSWTIANWTASSDSFGVMRYNITVPTDATPGIYAIVVDHGAIFTAFSVQGGYKVTVSPKTANGETSLFFWPGSSVVILANVRTIAGIATAYPASSVTAYITLPNGTTRNMTLNPMVQTQYPGQYNNTFNETSGSGRYSVRVDAVVGGTTYQGYTQFNTKTFNVKLEPQTDFFMEWGGSSAFGAGETVGFNIIATNLSTDEIFTVSAAGIPACNNSYLKLVNVFFPNGTSINNTIQNAAWTTGRFMMNQVCRIQFTGPNISSPYGIKVNVTIGGVTETAEGYFSIQKYFLKPTSVAGFGGDMEMMKMVAPGENTTITLTAYNITSKEQLGGGNITNIIVKKLLPLEFTLGIDEVTDLNYTVTYGATPQIVLTVPSNVRGPTSVEIEATVGGETVRGYTFFVANYLMGFLGPQMMGNGGLDGGGPPFSACSGVQVFSGTIKEVKTNQAVTAGAVVINSIAKATEEFTGRDVSRYVILSSNGTSQSGGSISINITFSPDYSFSGPYFIILNASYQGKSAGIPAGFMCKNLNFWPKVYSVGGEQSTWRIAPSSGVRIVISNISRMNDSKKIRNATVKIPRIFNFNPAKGGERILTPTKAFSEWAATNWLSWTQGTGPTWNVTSNLANFTIYPQNFTLDGTTALSEWPNGFIDLQPTICTESLGGVSTNPNTWPCDTGFGGFQVVAFDAWTENFQWGQSLSVGANLSYIVAAKTNVSLGCTGTKCDRAVGDVYTGADNTGFTVKIGRPWEGELTTISGVVVKLLQDGWNNTNDTWAERWVVNFTVPETIKKGEAMLLITINNSYGETTDVELWTTFTKYSITIPYDEGIGYWWGADVRCNASGYVNPIVNEGGAQWNLTVVNETLNIGSKQCFGSGRFMVAVKANLTSTRHLEGQEANLVYNPNLRLLLIDNNTAGTYDVMVMNNSGQLSWVSVNNRTISLNAYNTPGIYLIKIEGLYVKIINATATTAEDIAIYGRLPSWGGDGEVNKLHYIPYIVKLGNTPVSNAEVHVNSMIKQSDEGFGFEAMLTGGYNANGLIAAGQNYSYIKGTTDSLGVAFLRVNVTNSGRFKVFWKVNTSTDYDIATFASGTAIEMRKFKAWGQGIYWLPAGRVNLTWYDQKLSSKWNAFDNSTVSSVYYGIVKESANDDFVRDDLTSDWYIVYNPIANITCIDDDSNFTYGNPKDPINPDAENYPVYCFYLNSTTGGMNTSFGAADNTELAIGAYLNNTVINNITLVFFQNNPTVSGINIEPDKPYKNVSIKVCAETYGDPQNQPIEGGNVKLFARSFSPTGPAQTTWLTLYEPLHNSKAASGGGDEPTSTVRTGPSGCVPINMTHPTGWPMGCTEVQGVVIRGSDRENLWVGRVCR